MAKFTVKFQKGKVIYCESGLVTDGSAIYSIASCRDVLPKKIVDAWDISSDRAFKIEKSTPVPTAERGLLDVLAHVAPDDPEAAGWIPATLTNIIVRTYDDECVMVTTDRGTFATRRDYLIPDPDISWFVGKEKDQLALAGVRGDSGVIAVVMTVRFCKDFLDKIATQLKRTIHGISEETILLEE